jgi:hypothetical protein
MDVGAMINIPAALSKWRAGAMRTARAPALMQNTDIDAFA